MKKFGMLFMAAVVGVAITLGGCGKKEDPVKDTKDAKEAVEKHDPDDGGDHTGHNH